MSRHVFRNGAVFDGHRYRRRRDGGGRGRSDPSHVDGAGRGGSARDRASRSSTWPGAWSRPASSTRTCTRCRAGWSGSAATCRRRAPARSTSPSSRRTPARTPSEPWILGGGWAMAAFPGGTPTAADLDAIVPDRPVFLPNRDHHGAWVNSRALEIAGDRRDDARPGGRLLRAGRGRPADRHRARGCDGAWSPGTCPATDATTTTTAPSWPARPTCTRVGVTGWQDAILGDYVGHGRPVVDLPAGRPVRRPDRARRRRAVVGA